MSLCLPREAVCMGLQFSMSMVWPSPVGDSPPLLLLLLLWWTLFMGRFRSISAQGCSSTVCRLWARCSDSRRGFLGGVGLVVRVSVAGFDSFSLSKSRDFTLLISGVGRRARSVFDSLCRGVSRRRSSLEWRRRSGRLVRKI